MAYKYFSLRIIPEKFSHAAGSSKGAENSLQLQEYSPSSAHLNDLTPYNSCHMWNNPVIHPPQTFSPGDPIKYLKQTGKVTPQTSPSSR